MRTLAPARRARPARRGGSSTAPGGGRATLLALQRSAGNRAVCALVQRAGSVLRRGARGAEVERLQTDLTRATGANLVVDGAFGPATEAAVKAFQRAQGLVADGIVGPQTRAAIGAPAPGGGNAPAAGGGNAPAGGGSQPSSGGSTEAPTSGGGGGGGGVDVTTVRGITVASSIAGQVDELVGAAAADGVPLGATSSFRDPAQQISLRKKNCGTSQYDIYSKPSGQCTPPTAIPGASNHQKGLAIDFKYGDGSKKFGATPGFEWMKQNAGRFGLKNLPSEPWHWSTNGR